MRECSNSTVRSHRDPTAISDRLGARKINTAAQLGELLQLRIPPVAVAFSDSPPEGIGHVEDVAPSGCTYWKQASEGRTFYTEAPDHTGCAIGAFTHGVDLSEEQQQELNDLIGTMVELEYLDPAEVSDIPKLEGKFEVATYGPLAEVAFEPDAVLVCGTARQMMLLAEAAHSAGVCCETSMVGRPTCAAIPAVMRSGGSATNLGCIGNRVYTEISDDELYFIFAGSQLRPIVEKLATIVTANRELEKFHRARAS